MVQRCSYLAPVVCAKPAALLRCHIYAHASRVAAGSATLILKDICEGRKGRRTCELKLVPGAHGQTKAIWTDSHTDRQQHGPQPHHHSHGAPPQLFKSSNDQKSEGRRRARRPRRRRRSTISDRKDGEKRRRRTHMHAWPDNIGRTSGDE